MTFSDSTGPLLLIVSDDPGVASILTEGLLIAGFWTSTIASALQALEVFRLRTFDLIIVDAALQGLGAKEFLTRLRGNQRSTGAPLSERPAIVIAESSREMTETEAIDAGAIGIVYAPFEIYDLALALFTTVRSWRDAHPNAPWADELAQQR